MFLTLLQEFYSLDHIPELDPDEKKSSAIKKAETEPLAGETIDIWFVKPGTEWKPLPRYMNCALRSELSKWLDEKRKWEEVQKSRGDKPLTAKQDREYNLWLNNPTRKVVFSTLSKGPINPSKATLKETLAKTITTDRYVEQRVGTVLRVQNYCNLQQSER